LRKNKKLVEDAVFSQREPIAVISRNDKHVAFKLSTIDCDRVFTIESRDLASHQRCQSKQSRHR
jgi:hypothetical protein